MYIRGFWGLSRMINKSSPQSAYTLQISSRGIQPPSRSPAFFSRESVHAICQVNVPVRDDVKGFNRTLGVTPSAWWFNLFWGWGEKR